MNLHTSAAEETTAVSYKLLQVSSPAFKADEPIPLRYTCDGRNISPPLVIEGIPEKAKCLALIVEDTDAPGGSFVHWAIWNIPLTHHIKEGYTTGAQGMNDYGKHRYDGPCPPSGQHRYCFKVYALDTTLSHPVSANGTDLKRAMAGHILAFGELAATYVRRGQQFILL